MPNWCNGFVKVKGKNKDILKFSKLFICENDEGNKDLKEYFARSFTNQLREDFEEQIGKKDYAEFWIDFAWSVLSCLIEGYPQKNKECLTLIEACKKYNVSVVIESEEGGLGFEEKISCDEKGNLIYKENSMPSYKCKCGSEQQIPSDSDLNDVECWECGEIGKGVLKK